MHRPTRWRPSPSMVVALVALFISLGGTAIAARHYLITSTSQIKPSVVNALRGHNGAPGPQGPQGAQGAPGAQGAQGPPGVLGLLTVNGARRNYPPGESGGAPTAECPPGYTVVGTGFNGPFPVTGGFVLKFGNFVGGFFANESLVTVEGYVQAVCAQAPPSAIFSSVRGTSSARAAYRHRLEISTGELRAAQRLNRSRPHG
jgi:hypothetical protein